MAVDLLQDERPDDDREEEEFRAEKRRALSLAVQALEGVSYSTDDDTVMAKLLAAFEAITSTSPINSSHVIATALWWTLEAQTCLDFDEVDPYSDAGSIFLAFAQVIGMIQTAEHLKYLSESISDGLGVMAQADTLRRVREVIASEAEASDGDGR